MNVSEMGQCLVALALFLSVPAPARAGVACQPCGKQAPPCAAFGWAANVFVGTVADVRPPHDGTLPSSETRTIAFTVERWYKGAGGRTFEAKSIMDSCEHFVPRAGEKYLVYAGKEGALPNVVLNGCERTRLAADAAEDLRYLESVSRGALDLSVNGQVRRGRNEGFGNARVRVEGGGKTREVTTGEDGGFGVAVDGAGKYAVTITVDGEYETDGSYHHAFKSQEMAAGRTTLKYEADVAESRCWYVSIVMSEGVR